MRKYLYTIMATLLMLTLASCHKEEDDLFATGCIMLSTPDGMAIDMVQAQAILTNVNTRQVTTTSDFTGERLCIDVLRGAYKIGIEGVATVHDTDGRKLTRQFRSQSEYIDLSNTGVNNVTLRIIYLD